MKPRSLPSIYSYTDYRRFLRDSFLAAKKADPLIALDLSDPSHPEVAGELEVPGFSTYLHPVDQTHLLAVGKDAEDMGSFAWFQGLQLSLFDVSDLSHPVQVDKVIIGSRGTDSEALHDPKALTYDSRLGLLAVPVTLYQGGTGGSDYGDFSSVGLYVYRVRPDQGFDLAGVVDHTQDACAAGRAAGCSASPLTSVRRSLIIGEGLFSVSQHLMRISRVEDLSEIADPLPLD